MYLISGNHSIMWLKLYIRNKYKLHIIIMYYDVDLYHTKQIPLPSKRHRYCDMCVVATSIVVYKRFIKSQSIVLEYIIPMLKSI